MPKNFNLSGEVGEAVLVAAVAANVVNIDVPPGVNSAMVICTAAAGTNLWVRQAASTGAMPAQAGVKANPADMTVVNAISVLDIARIQDPVLGFYISANATLTVIFYNSRKTLATDGSDSTTFSRTVVTGLKRVA